MSSTEWVPGQWDQIAAGDRVKLVHDDGEQAIIGTAGYNYSADLPIFSWPKGAGNICFYAKDTEWSLFVEAPTKPELPTVPGAYASTTGALWVLNRDGDWLDFSIFGGGVNNEAAANSNYHPFTLLAPVEKTAKEILGKLDAASVRAFEGALGARREIYDGDWNDVADEFGVTS